MEWSVRRRPTRLLTDLLAALAGVLLLPPPASAAPGPLRHVALGDSGFPTAQHPGVPPQLQALSADT
jgi:hypothetical protein